MQTRFALGAAALLLFSMGVVGCSNTAEGAKEDTAKDTQAVGAAADRAANAVNNAADRAASATQKAAANVADATKDTAKNTAEATEITPKVKLAITNDKQLNDTRNLINVDSKDGVVHLKGHVISDAEKQHAEQVATQTLKEANSTDTVSNELTVKP